MTKKLSIIIPAYQEESTLEKLVDSVFSVQLPDIEKEVLIIDDGSKDQTPQIMKRLEQRYPELRLFFHQYNQGKGAAIQRGMDEATGDIVLIQDADLEYDPNDYQVLIEPILKGRADVVYGSRFITSKSHRVLYFWHSAGNRFLTLVSNMLTDLNLSDMETCYKVFRREVIKQISLKEKRFGCEPEITAKIARIRPKLRIYEVGISYFGRTYEEGKKIGWRDGLWALWCLIKYRFFA
jgi:glycosyltransferase involved in cell wall biosynthesis